MLLHSKELTSRVFNRQKTWSNHTATGIIVKFQVPKYDRIRVFDTVAQPLTP